MVADHKESNLRSACQPAEPQDVASMSKGRLAVSPEEVMPIDGRLTAVAVSEMPRLDGGVVPKAASSCSRRGFASVCEICTYTARFFAARASCFCLNASNRASIAIGGRLRQLVHAVPQRFNQPEHEAVLRVIELPKGLVRVSEPVQSPLHRGEIRFPLFQALVTVSLTNLRARKFKGQDTFVPRPGLSVEGRADGRKDELIDQHFSGGRNQALSLSIGRRTGRQLWARSCQLTREGR